MNEINNSVTYEGGSAHNIWVDYDYQINTNEDIVTFADNLNDWD
ncbi:hypothetical protein [uncultured Duncaniella sp.]|nr:hypothetical protein [uncultured Duncaniella sp.]